jgi:hypothetical protein
MQKLKETAIKLRLAVIAIAIAAVYRPIEQTLIDHYNS